MVWRAMQQLRRMAVPATSVIFLLTALSLGPCCAQKFIIASMPTAEEVAMHNMHGTSMGTDAGDPNDPITPDRVRAGRIPTCDDGKTNLTVDWDGSKDDYTCPGPQWPTPANTALQLGAGYYYDRLATHYTGHARWLPRFHPLPAFYYGYPDNRLWCEATFPKQAIHFCMKDKIKYTQNPPTSGDHRPSWAVYGEYLYLPVQRWLHNMEHGTIVMLYHPCADPVQVEKLRSIVTGCIRRHIITPYNKLSKETPYALLAWGCKLLMGSVDEQAAMQFIQTRAKHGAEDLSMEGQFMDQLLRKAAIVSDFDDSVLCPKAPFSLPGVTLPPRDQQLNPVRRLFM
ncbi:uncharacterized protein LOC129598730 isoform X1 [Paramacrobiotus metropolitanus]|uniref:uncharacterized protein LOC129598730 isoform X1 n=1 Tax=Paramacrobiotus metropolitanus TaxID=2943436 RepID=UPI0024458BC1|nr:uncharacterized protein LOC129598730 isoform X1 [Paramacrobiotus metropolitanus]